MDSTSTDMDAGDREPLLRTISEPVDKKANLSTKTQKEQMATNLVGQPLPQPAAFVPTQRADLPPGTSLASLFRYHMGIDHDESLVPPHLASQSAIDPIATGKNQGRRAVNLGIYNRCIREERGTNQSYQIWSFVINGALGCQVVFAAVLTALGAGGGSHALVAVFGTLNTIIAGFLTYLKGTGLPMRMKYFHNQWLKLRAYIEQRERDFASDDLSRVHRITYEELMEEVDIVEKMYHNIRKDVERHTPDNFGGKNDNSASEAPGEGAPEASLASRGLNAKKAKAAKSFSDDLEAHLGGRSKSKPQTGAASQYGATDAPAKSNGKAVDKPPAPAVEELEDEGEEDDVTTIAMEREREIRQRTEAAQEQAEKRVKELEAKLAAMEKSKDQNGGS